MSDPKRSTLESILHLNQIIELARLLKTRVIPIGILYTHAFKMTYIKYLIVL